MNYLLSDKPYKDKQEASTDIEHCKWERYNNATQKELYNALLQGYSYSPVFNGSRRLLKNFRESYFVFIDIDDSDIPLSDYILSHFGNFEEGLEFLCDALPPTFAYPSFRHHLNLDDRTTIYKFHLVWAFSRPLNAEQYKAIQETIIRECNIETYDAKTLEVGRCYFGTSSSAEECYYNGAVYDPLMLFDNYTISISTTCDDADTYNFEIPEHIQADLFSGKYRATDVLYKYKSKSLKDYLLSTPTFTKGKAKLWTIDDYKEIKLPYNGKYKITDGKKRRWAFSQIMIQLKDINPDIEYWEFLTLGIIISNFYFENDRDFGDLKSVKDICNKDYNVEPKDIVWFCKRSVKSNYITRGLKEEGVTRTELIEAYKESATFQFCSIDNNIHIRQKSKMALPKPTTIEEAEKQYKEGKISRRTYFRWKKRLKE